MNNGPLPTRILFLSDLPTQTHGTKIRFLGCVTRYTLSTGVLELQHAYHLPPDKRIVALVDVNVILESLNREDTHVGAWVNVMGYVEDVVKEGNRERGHVQGRTVLANRKGERVRERPRAVGVRVQAIMLWGAGGLKIGDYERTVEARLKLEKES